MDNIIREAILLLSKTNKKEYKQSFKKEGELFTITIEKSKPTSSESVKLSKHHSISAAPSGQPCSYCHGSGRES